MVEVTSENISELVDSQRAAGTRASAVSPLTLPESKRGSGLRHWGVGCFAVDLLSSGAAALGSYSLWEALVAPSAIPSPWVALVPAMTSLAATALLGGYDARADFMSLRYAVEQFVGQLVAGAFALLFVSVVLTYGSGRQPSRGWLLTYPVFFAGLSVLHRRTFSKMRPEGAFGGTTVAVLGSDEDADELALAVLRAGTVRKVHTIDPAASAAQLDAELASLGRDLDSVVIGPRLRALGGAELERLLDFHVHTAPVLTWNAYFNRRLKKVPLSTLSEDWIFMADLRLSGRTFYAGLKRASDVLAALVLGGLALPFMALIWMLIRLESRGPAIFRQERVGAMGSHFTLVKFRTMRADAVGGTTAAGDPRVTRFGRWLRKYRLDELPQLWNVFKGDMSLIGPRPEWTRCVELYEQEIPLYHLRHLVRPGLTGWAQVNYSYGENTADAREKFSYDLYYIRNFSFILDCVIAVKTVYVMAFGHGGR